MSRAMRKRRIRGHVIADLSVNYVERQVLLAGNTLERYTHDYGLDLEMWSFDESGEVESGFVLVQVKSTDGLRIVEAGTYVAVRIDRRDYRFWSSLPVPVVLVMYDAVNDEAFWIHVQEYVQATRSSNVTEFSSSITVRIPASQRLTIEAIRVISRLKEVVR